ncbi:HAD domain-containing protein [Ectopseudomonas chengduensis]
MIKTNYSQVVFLDFDGVLHPDSVFLIGKEPKLRGNGQLFMWAPLLTEILMEFPHVKIVLSTSWVRHLGFHRTRNQLPPVIQNRIIGSTWHSEMARGWADQDWWDKSTRHDQICRYVARAHLPNWLAIDDDPAGWPHDALNQLILCDGSLGLGDVNTAAQLKARLNELCRP